MNWPPMLMHVEIKGKKHDFGLWLPLFLLLPLALVVMIIVSPFILIAILILFATGQGRWVWWGLRCVKVAILSLCSLRGLKLDIQKGDEYVFISVV
jgi:hypothetical protein